MPDAAEWAALLRTGYTTMEQQALHNGTGQAPPMATASTETTFF